MTITPAQIDALPDFTNAQMVKVIRAAIATLAADPDAQTSINNRMFTRRNLDELQGMLRMFTELAAQDADAVAADSQGCPVVRRQEPQL